ncbi:MULTISPECIES: HGGxSTG domain-containing protein [Sphingobium]|uniref:HGGxSTG domain-containing protein n=1 Tax=Sphingobium TaxID=165695 RepID=UPI0039656F9C
MRITATDRQVCGAVRRDGEPCQKMPMRNGRCHLHGGKTPSRKRLMSDVVSLPSHP